MTEIGRVAAIRRFPVKSMRGEAMASAALGWHGLDGDRRFAFYKSADGSRFPWLTGRDVADLVLHTARWVETASADGSPIRVTTPAGADMGLRDPALGTSLAAAAGCEVGLLQLGRGTFDSMPVSVVTRATLAALDDGFGRPLDEARFRINIVVDSEERESGWLGGALIFGDDDGPRLRVNRRIQRCRMITIDPDTAAQDPSILRMVAERFDNEIGVYCTPETIGALREGDRVRLAR